jgi:2-phospho-L-lactate guanylyltransferase (CobY/MobA/RfbA family)
VAAATAAGLAVRTVAIPALELDLDTPADVAAFMEHQEATGTRAGKLLARWAVVSRL